jgi:N-6 DNA Methylase
METHELLEALGYDDRSPSFLTPDRFSESPEHAHVFRRAQTFGLRGVYLLRRDPAAGASASTPIVYVAEAGSIEQADDIHRKVWNQDVVPFLLVKLPKMLRVYAGFTYQAADASTTPEQQGVLEAAIQLNEVAAKLSEFRAQAIDEGALWRKWGKDVDPRNRVDWKLLGHLKLLAKQLREEDLDPDVAHALIGKYIYLSYLDERGLLPKKLNEWGIARDQIFGRRAQLTAFRLLNERIEKDWLNGSIFPIPFSGKKAPTSDHIQHVASVFLGDDTATDQLHLGFKAYDFSCIPIETLSVIYENFLGLKGKNRESGAYYTPIPLVNFMIAELEDVRPLEEGMRVLDPSCGSGAFLVQCYRRLIEKRLGDKQRPLRPDDHPEALRKLLEQHIFGVDRDGYACQVAAMSLVMTLLDSIETEVLERNPGFKLPKLHIDNIFEADFFDPHSPWAKRAKAIRYDWVIGNPPWLKLPVKGARALDRPALAWIQAQQATQPVVGNQVAEAFAWKSGAHLAPSGAVGLLLPAKTLFDEKREFRREFFRQMDVTAVANFANLREVLFPKRDSHDTDEPGQSKKKKRVGARHPAAAFFYKLTTATRPNERADVLVYSPLVVNQEANRPARPGARKEVWSIVLNASEVRTLPWRALESGDPLPFKIAMWGSPRDEQLLSSLESRFPALSSYAGDKALHGTVCAMHEGPALRWQRPPVAGQPEQEELDALPGVAGKYTIDSDKLRGSGRIYAFPRAALKKVTAAEAFVRKGRGKLTLSVCKKPHIIVSETRSYAVFSDEFLVVPHNYPGIAGPPEERSRLIALSLYLSSSFAFYHDFFRSPNGGITGRRSTLSALRSLPFPFTDTPESALEEWVELHAQLAKTPPRAAPRAAKKPKRAPQRELFPAEPADLEPGPTDPGSTEETPLEARLNEMVYALLGLTETERSLVNDVARVRRHLVDGTIGEPAVKLPTETELEEYAAALQRQLGEYVAPALNLVHRVTVVHDVASRRGMAQIELAPRAQPGSPIRVLAADARVGREIAALSDENRQWLYFDRNLFVYRDDRIFILKPLQMVHWTERQGLLDANEIIAQALAPREANRWFPHPRRVLLTRQPIGHLRSKRPPRPRSAVAG